MADTELPQGIETSENERTQALERFYVIRPFLEDGVPLAQIAKERDIPRRTLTRWVKQYRETGLDGLTRQGRADKGEQRNMPPDLKPLIEGLALSKPRRTRAAIHRQVMRVAKEQGWPVPSYSQVSAIIDALDPGLVVLAHEGSKAYREQFDLLYRFEAEAPNHLWQKEIGAAPQARWEASGFLPQMPDSLEQLDLLLLQGPALRKKPHSRKVDKCGTVFV